MMVTIGLILKMTNAVSCNKDGNNENNGLDNGNDKWNSLQL